MWRRDGYPVDDEALQELGLVDQSGLFECEGVAFRFTSMTVERDARGHRAHTSVLTLRQLAPRVEPDAIDLVEIVAEGKLSGRVPELAMRKALAASIETSEQVARRYAARELFRTAERLLTARSVA